MTRKPYTEEEIQALLQDLVDGPQGTPGSLDQALEHISRHLRGVAWGSSEIRIARMHLKDFMAQRFTAAMHRHPEAEGILLALYRELFS